MSELVDTVILVTGGSRGIGTATVRALHRAGATVAFTYVTGVDAARALEAELGERVSAFACDIADHEAIVPLIGAVVERCGALHVLVNNAATFAENRFDEPDYERWRAGWQRTFAVNCFGAANLTWAALRVMREQRRGTIINIASRAAHRGELTFADYGASKAALTNLTKSIARSCAGDGIVAFTVAPGFIETEMAASEIAQRGDEIRAEIPSGRIGTPDDVAGIVAFLASPTAAYATGSTIDVNGASYVR